MPAKVHRRNRRNGIFAFKNKIWISCFFLFLTFFVATISFLLVQDSLWDGRSKLSYAVYKENQIEVVVLDSDYKELNTIVIPQDTLVDVARGLGKTKIKNVYGIGINENLGGRLLHETTTFALALPAYHYVYYKSYNSSEFFGRNIRLIFWDSKSSFSFSERVKFFLFALFNKDIRKNVVNLAQTSFLRKAVLVDGSEGYVKTPFMPQSVQSIFSVSDEIFTVSIISHSGSAFNLDDLANTFASLGGKVISVKKIDEKKKTYFKNGSRVLCELKVKDKKLGNEIRKYFQMCNINVIDQNEKSVEMVNLSLE
ncbi:MAG: hypothetical protein NZM26_02630 [Patescibacteria group bacterium]|nr:hypothetical protein [Patescibacteria group bacterium]